MLSELSCAFLYAQLEELDVIRKKRNALFKNYVSGLAELEQEGLIRLPSIPSSSTCNYHMFYVILSDQSTRDSLMEYLRKREIYSVFHYVPLHTSPMGRTFGYEEGDLPNTELYSGRLLRLPFFNELNVSDQSRVVEEINRVFRSAQS